jgi:hypothetical protein
VLGLLRERPSGTDFVPASSFRMPHAARANWWMLDARYGCVLFYDTSDPRAMAGTKFVVWDPVTDDTWRIPVLRSLLFPWSAALLCAAAGCDHLDCRGGRQHASGNVGEEPLIRLCVLIRGRCMEQSYLYAAPG